MIYSASEASREFLTPQCHLQTFTIVGRSKQCT
jgi:hypothetical protein